MKHLILAFAAGLMLAQPAVADDQPATQNAINWDIFQKLYPKRAIAAREEGAVGFIVTLDKKGDVTRCQVTHSSGHPLLDEETCQIITLHAQFNAVPSLGPSQTRTHEGLIAWKLPASSTVLESPKPVVVAKAPEKVVCKRTARVGTLAGFERTCMTPTEWAKQSDYERQMWDEVQGKKGATNDQMCMSGGCDSTLGQARWNQPDARPPH
jgi:TonB family protein